MTDPRLVAAQRALDADDPSRAARAATEVVDDPRAPAAARSLALRLRAEACVARGDAAAALADAERAVSLAPGDPRAWSALGIVAADVQDPARAVEAFGRAVALDPSYARAWNNLGNALRSAGRAIEAHRAFERAVAADPRYAFGWTNLAVARRAAGDDAGAVDAAKRALACDARQRTARLVIAGIDRRAGRLDPAIAAYEAALSERPADAAVRYALAGALAERDDVDEARSAYIRAARDDPGLLRARLGAELTLPMVPASAAAIAETRERYARGLDRLAGELPALASALPAARVIDELRWTNFLLAYQGEDDRELQSRYGDLVAATLAAARGAVPRCGDPRPGASGAGSRRRVAFVSAFFRDGTVGRYFESWITGLDPRRHEVAVHHLAAGEDALTARLRAHADSFVAHGASPPSRIAADIVARAYDVIVYPELGMDAATFALASLRLAPRQVAGWGHPVTTGLPTIDEMLTSGPMEPPGADAHYRERLRRLPGLGTRYARPRVPGAADRQRLGLPAQGALILFPQSLFKLHPDDDTRIARVLAAAPDARILAYTGRHPKLTAAWRSRLDRTLAAHDVDADRVVVLRQTAHDDYLRVNLACDAMLDSVRWSGGNTSLDAIACGLPIATRPGTTMRARQSAAMLAQIGTPELVAQDEDACVALAARLAADRDWRDRLAHRMAVGAAALFDDGAPLAALDELLDRD
ncbi:MAG: tetratricopeptide repeat protein [Burkholderiales bacterium]|nr:tetratricopeptide repeat protein [Burkholderiales bacterium]